jgi:Tol biopolymer transport system component
MGWTADGTAIVLMAERSGHWSVSKQNLNSDSAEVIVSGKEGAEVDSPRVSSDGSWIFYLEVPTQGWTVAPSRLMRVPVQGGSPEFMLSGQIVSGGLFPSGSGSSLYIAERSADQRELTFSAVDPAHGRGRVLGHFSGDPSAEYALGISPDGRWIGIAKSGDKTLQLLNTGAGQSHQLTAKGLGGFYSLDFSADGRGIFTTSQADGKWALFYVNLTGQSHPVISMDSKAVFWGIPSRDGKHLALFVQSFDANMWALQDF